MKSLTVWFTKEEGAGVRMAGGQGGGWGGRAEGRKGQGMGARRNGEVGKEEQWTARVSDMGALRT